MRAPDAPDAKRGCRACHDAVPLPDFTMAFQPIVDVVAGSVYAHEALVRPQGGGSAADVLACITEAERYAFDQACRVKAIELAAALDLEGMLSINFLPNAVYDPNACLRRTLEAARHHHYASDRLIFEVTEAEPTRDPGHLKRIFETYQRRGMKTAIDDFGAGHSGLNLLAEFLPDIVKIDMALTRALHRDPVRRSITAAIVSLCRSLGIEVIAEGIEERAELEALRALGVRLFQGFLIARPVVGRVPVLAEPSLWMDAAVHASAAEVAAEG